MRPRYLFLAAALLAGLIASLFSPVLPAAQDGARIVVVGDVHGDLPGLLTVLRDADLIDGRNDWRGGDARLVQLGDLPDRGPDTRRIVELMQRWQRQAAAAGGAVHGLIGNHEAMNMLGDLRYVHPGEYEAFRGWGSRSRRNRLYRDHLAQRSRDEPGFEPDAAYREAFDARYPLGFVEHRIAWAPGGEIGAWVLEQPAVLRLGRILLLHGGISPELTTLTIEEINARIRQELAGTSPRSGLAEAETGPLWYRGLALQEGELAEAQVDAVLAAFDVDHIVVGHTPLPGAILPRFGGRVIVADAGLSAYYGGHRLSLEIRGGEFFARHGLRLLPLPMDEAPLSPYLRELAELGSADAALLRRIEALEALEASGVTPRP